MSKACPADFFQRFFFIARSKKRASFFPTVMSREKMLDARIKHRHVYKDDKNYLARRTFHTRVLILGGFSSRYTRFSLQKMLRKIFHHLRNTGIIKLIISRQDSLRISRRLEKLVNIKLEFLDG